MNVALPSASRAGPAAAGHAASYGYAYTGGKAFDAKLPTVVFVHGALHDHSAWTLAARWFAHHGHGVLALDLPGHGRSSQVRDMAGPAEAISPSLQIGLFRAETAMTGLWHRTLDMSAVRGRTTWPFRPWPGSDPGRGPKRRVGPG